MPLDSNAGFFLAKFDRFIALTTHSGAYISRFSDFCVHSSDNNDIMTKLIALPLAHVHRVKIQFTSYEFQGFI